MSNLGVDALIVNENSVLQIVLALIAIIASFGTALGWLIRRQDTQNEHLTDRFLTFMETSAVHSTEANVHMVSSLSEVTATLAQVTATLLVVREQDRLDHHDIIEAIGKIPSARIMA